MFEENENLVEETTENVEEQTTEEIAQDGVVDGEGTETSVEQPEQPQVREDVFTKEQVDEMIAKKIARKEAKLRKEYENKYGRLEAVVNAGLGTKDTNEAVEKLTDFYTKKGIQIPSNQTNYSERELEVLANADADEIISLGYDEIVDEVDRMTELGYENMSKRDKLVFSKLANERQRIEDEKDLASIGVSKEQIDNDEFRAFAEKLNPNLSLKDKYEMYLKTQPKREIKQMGSMIGGQTSDVKTYYSPEEIAKLTEEDLDKPGVWEAVRKSMTGQV